MKYFLIILLFISFSIYGAKNVVSVIVKSETSIPDDFQNGIEEELTSYGYYLCEGNGCKDIYLQVNVNIIKKSKNVYRFKAKFLDLKKKRALSIKTLYFKGSINDYEKLMTFGKELTKLIVENIKNLEAKKIKQEVKAKAKAESKAKAKAIKSARKNMMIQRMQKYMNRTQLEKIDPNPTKTVDAFYNSVMTHPPIINIR